MNKIYLLLSLILLVSCQENKSNARANEEPKALQEKSINLGRLKGENDLVDDLYQELVDKSPELKALETELNQFTPTDTLNLYFNYDQKSSDYYRSAKNHADLITDSIMKQKILKLIADSEEKYTSKKTALKALVKTSIKNKKYL
ncbi:hypothetical protein ACFFWB_26970 [Flavobacterium procerum]|uniref:hypothetical protein n=1 Tax=Flavobacterium procerum TaxID=1455569 RepID=UPI0035EFDA2F